MRADRAKENDESGQERLATHALKNNVTTRNETEEQRQTGLSADSLRHACQCRVPEGCMSKEESPWISFPV